MDTKDVKVGMKVIPHNKTFLHDGGLESFIEPRRSDCCVKHLMRNGFLTVIDIHGNDELARGVLSCGNCTGWPFHVTDFSPAVVEPGDTVKILTNHGPRCCQGREGVAYIGGDDLWSVDLGNGEHSTGYTTDELELVRKGKPVIEVGDTVRVNGTETGRTLVDEEGTIVRRIGGHSFWVNFKNNVGGWGDDETKILCGHGWTCTEGIVDITLIRKAAQSKPEPEGFKVGDRVEDTEEGLGTVEISDGTDTPYLVNLDKGAHLWYYPDGRCNVGKSRIHLAKKNPASAFSVGDRVTDPEHGNGKIMMEHKGELIAQFAGRYVTYSMDGKREGAQLTHRVEKTADAPAPQKQEAAKWVEPVMVSRDLMKGMDGELIDASAGLGLTALRAEIARTNARREIEAFIAANGGAGEYEIMISNGRITTAQLSNCSSVGAIRCISRELSDEVIRRFHAQLRLLAGVQS